jgi:hypothetical protein
MTVTDVRFQQFNMLLIFLFFGAGKVITMPNWWGNDAESVDKCYSLDNS